MAVVMADAGPLIALAKINQLSLLTSLFGTVLVTKAVMDECIQGKGIDADLIAGAVDSKILQCINTPDVKQELSRSLGLGEKSCIEYALQDPKGTLLIIDDALARKQAVRHGLSIVGTAALLFMAEKKGLLDDAENFIQQLNAVGYRISDKVLMLLKK